MGRSAWKFLSFNHSFLRSYIQTNFFKKKKKIILYDKATKINKLFIMKSVYLHKGNSFLKFRISNFFMGQIIGCFIITRRPFKYVSKNKKK